jgi:hypothetical protein
VENTLISKKYFQYHILKKNKYKKNKPNLF